MAKHEKLEILQVAVAILALVREGKLNQKTAIPNFTGDPGKDPYGALAAIVRAIEDLASS